MLVGAALRRGQHAVMRRVGDDLDEAGDAPPGAVADLRVGRQREERGQALEVDREIRRGVELGHLPALEVIEPAADPVAADRRLLGAGAAGADEAPGGQQVSGEVGGGVEQERVVLGEVPLDVVAGLVQPVAVAEDGGVDARTQRGVERRGVALARPDQRHQREVGAVPAVGDRPERPLEHRLGCRPGPAGREPRQRGDGVGLAVLGDGGERLVDAGRRVPRRRSLRLRMGDLQPQAARRGEALALERDPEGAEVGGQVLGAAEREVRLAGGELAAEREAAGEHALAFDVDARQRRAGERPRQDQAYLAAGIGGPVEMHRLRAPPRPRPPPRARRRRRSAARAGGPPSQSSWI